MKGASSKWKYCSLGGAIRVKVDTGADLMRLGELDQKCWTVLSCPVSDLEMDRHTLALIDTDRDGKIKVREMVAAARWLCSVIKDKDSIFRGGSELRLDNFDCSDPEGKRLHDSAVRILGNLGIRSETISLENASDSEAIFRNTLFNGDGVIIPESSEDPDGRLAIEACMRTVGSAVDRSGKAGVTAPLVEEFYSACSDYDSWLSRGEAGRSRIFPLGDGTAAALDAVEAVRGKVEDYFKRCRLLEYDSAAAAAVDVRVSAIDDIQSCPIAHPRADRVLPFDGINPFWNDAFCRVRTLVFDKCLECEGGITESQWNEVLAMFVPYSEWLGARKGSVVEPLGAGTVKAIIASDKKQYLLGLVARDLELEQESNSIDDVRKLMLFYRDYARLLDNYLIFSDFYARSDGRRAIFEAGRLYIDQRCCDLCIRVNDMAGHAEMAKLSGMFLIYCKCVSKPLGRSMDIVAVMTEGDISDLRAGKNGVFYDRDGNDWDATVTKVVDNPVSVRQAFWTPYRKFWDFCVGLISKSASDKDSKIAADLQGKASAAVKPGTDASPQSGKQTFDIAKFAGIFAALGLALGYIGSFLTKLAAGIAATPWWQLLLAVAAVMLVISGPSCIIAWSRLRKRNLGPVLNANGWAINSRVLVNTVFGAKLTSVASYPRLHLADPNALKGGAWWKWLVAAVITAAVVLAVLHFTGTIDLGLGRITLQ